MKIGVNSYFFRFPASGTGQYLLHLLQALAQIDQENEYVLLDSQPISSTLQTSIEFPHLVSALPRFARHNASIEKLIWEQYTALSAARKARVDLLYVPYFAPPFFPGMPSVIT